MIASKYFADFLTFSRLLLASCLAWLGWSRGVEGLQLAALLMILSWTSDVIDGILARRSQVLMRTWIGDHDLYFDMSVAIGLLIYLTAAGYINTSLSIVYILFWSFLFWRFGILSVLGKLLQTPIYAWFIFVTFRFEPVYGWIIVIFLLFVIGFTWPRFPKETVPDFVSGFGQVEDSTQNGFENGPNNANNSFDGDVRQP